MKTKQERIMTELINGQGWTKELQILIQKPFGDDVSALQKELVDNISRSFTQTLLLLNTDCDSGEVSQIPATTQVGSPGFGDQRSVDSGESSKRPAAKDRRGGYKRRKTSGSWIKVSASMEDDHAWRKYGQKEILNSKFPRCYFRCTHKHDQGCKAIKQVQKIQEEPHMYRITYFGHHTCRNYTLQSLQNNISDSDLEESHLINFKSNNTSDQIYPSPSFGLSIKDEHKEEEQSDFNSDKLPPLDTVGWMDLKPLMRSDNDGFLSSFYSCGSTSFRIPDMELLLKSDDFQNPFLGDGNEFF